MMDGNPAIATSPGPDAQPQDIGYHVRAILAIVGADRQILPDEAREIQALMAGLQAIGTQKAEPMQQPGMASNETSDFGSSPEAEEMDQPEQGAEYL